MDSSQSFFSTESLLVALPGYRWVEFITHKAEQPLSVTSPRQVLERLVTDPAFIDKYLGFSEAAHGPYLAEKLLSEDFLEQPVSQEPHPVMHAILSGTGVYEDRAPKPDAETLKNVSSRLSAIPKDSSYFVLKLDPTKEKDKLSDLGWIFVEYSQHFFVSSTKDSIYVVTIGCE
jgi:hypothetical protein